MSLRGFATLNIWADDVAAAESWYAEFLGAPAYYHRNGPDGRLAYVEFRIGDFPAELGIIDRRWAPGDTTAPGGAIMHWHVDDLEGTYARLLALGAEPHMPITAQGDGEGFVTASVVDPFGNVLGVMYNPHYVEVTGAARPQ
jgi:uncharacterized glyoxalase superfamily protein PhnB